jgi:preprotein translocase subunit SecD
MSNLKYRLILIAALVLASVWFLFPRDVEVRLRRPDGTFYDTVQKRIPLRRGLDLQGGMHLALEVDESQRAVADKADAIDRALKVVTSESSSSFRESTTGSARSKSCKGKRSSSSGSPTRRARSSVRCLG